MIFAKTYKLVLAGRKTQTLRLQYAGDYLGETADGRVAVYRDDNKPRWIVGNTYAVQPERCHHAVCRVRCTGLREVENPLHVDRAFVIAEGFDTPEEYLRIWHELHRRNPVQRCWAISFEKVTEDRR